MRLIDAEQYRKEFLNSRDFEPMKILDFQPTVQAIPIPKGATNGDVIKAMFPKIEIYTDVINEIVDVEICEDSSELRCSIDWWNTPYKGVKNEQRNDR